MSNIITKIWNQRIKAYLAYSLCFWGFIIPKTYDMYKYGYVALGGWDAITQMYPVMLYVTRMIRGFFKNPTIPLFELSLGMGDDLITTLNWHGFGDPFYLLTVFVSESNLPFFYTFLFYFRVYLGGLAFLWFVREHNKTSSTSAYVMGTLVYIFSGFTMQANIHIIFVHAMMYIPLLLLGGERALKGKKKGVLMVSAFLFALSGFFFLYIGSIALGVYVIYRLVRMHGSWKDSLLKIAEIAVEYLLGLALAAFILIPAILGFFASNRAHIQSHFDGIYSWKKIKDCLVNLFFPQTNYQVLSVMVIGVIVMLHILLAKGKKREKWNSMILLVLTWIPAVSCVMSGFGEIYDRWELVSVLYIAFLVVGQWDFLNEMNILQKVLFIGLFCIMGLVGKKKDWWDTQQFKIVMVSYGLILAFLLFFYPIAVRKGKYRLCRGVFFAVMVVCICKSWHCNSIDREISYVRERNVVDELIDDDSVYRVSNERTFTEPRNGQNIALFQNYYGLSEYFSIENPCFTKALLEWDVNPDSSMNHMNVGLDQRTVLETLSAVKYMVKRTASNVLIPYGYIKVKETKDGEWSLYKNRNALPLFYTYDSVMTDGACEGKNGFEKQQMMLHTAQIEDYDGELPRKDAPAGELQQTSYQIVNIEKGRLDGHMLYLKAGAKLTLQASLGTQGENYISFDEVDLNGSYSVELPREKRLKEVNISKDFYNGNAGVNLGPAKTAEKQKIFISFYKAEKFPINHLKIYNYDFSTFSKCIKERKAAPVTNISVKTNRMECDIHSNKARVMCVSVPFSKGWKARVDGKETKIYHINDMFMGIEIPKGTHHIVMDYFTYGLKIGMFISLSALLIILFVAVKNKCYHWTK